MRARWPEVEPALRGRSEERHVEAGGPGWNGLTRRRARCAGFVGAPVRRRARPAEVEPARLASSRLARGRAGAPGGVSLLPGRRTGSPRWSRLARGRASSPEVEWLARGRARTRGGELGRSPPSSGARRGSRSPGGPEVVGAAARRIAVAVARSRVGEPLRRARTGTRTRASGRARMRPLAGGWAASQPPNPPKRRARPLAEDDGDLPSDRPVRAPSRRILHRVTGASWLSGLRRGVATSGAAERSRALVSRLGVCGPVPRRAGACLAAPSPLRGAHRGLAPDVATGRALMRSRRDCP